MISLIEPITAYGTQPDPPDESFSNFAKLGFTASGVAAAGFIPTAKGRIWDSYLKGIRLLETGFPSAILRTFKVSESLSPLESWSKVEVSANDLKRAGKYAEYLKNVFGEATESVSLNKSGSIFGDVIVGGEKVGIGMQIDGGEEAGHDDKLSRGDSLQERLDFKVRSAKNGGTSFEK